MREYECVCLQCGSKQQHTFPTEPYPEPDDIFMRFCRICQENTKHQRTLTQKALAALRKKQQEDDLRETIVKKCMEYGFHCRFLYQSVIVMTNLSDWCFDYHLRQITLYHESTVKINFATENYAKAHIQFAKKKITPTEVIEYIAKHDALRAKP